MTQARFLLNVERKGTPMTVNDYFNTNLEARYCILSPALVPGY